MVSGESVGTSFLARHGVPLENRGSYGQSGMTVDRYIIRKNSRSLLGFSWSATADRDESDFGRYLQNLWEKSDDIESIEHSNYRKVGDVECTVQLVVDRTQWKRLTAETLCT